MWITTKTYARIVIINLITKRLMGMTKPFQIEVGEWWFKGCFIQEQNHPQLDKYVVFQDTVLGMTVGTASRFSDAIQLCKDNEVTDYIQGIEAFGFKQPLTKKYKTYGLTTYHRGVELQLLCVTTSKKKFAELSDISLSHINGYAHDFDLRYPVCNENPDKLYAKAGMGGEAMFIFNRDEVKPLDEYKQLINKHREQFPSNRDFYESQR
jgi:hypothetical protein